MSEQNLDNIDSKEEKNEEIQKSENKENSKTEANNSIIYTLCVQTNFTLKSNHKTFNMPLSIGKSSLNFQSTKKILMESKENSPTKNNKKNYIQINNASIFIGGRQNLKGMRLYLSSNFKYNNTAHREITDFRNNKNKSVDTVNRRLKENKNVEKISIDLNEKEKEKENDLFSEALKIINLRWKNNQKIYKSRISFSSNKESIIIINKKNYIQNIINKIEINPNQNKKVNNQEYYILIKQDNYNKNKNIIHEMISPKTNEELEYSINDFIYKTNDNKNSNDNISNPDNYLINGKKKSKFSNKKIIHIKKINEKTKPEDFAPIFILSKKDIIDLYEILEKKPNKKEKKVNYSIDKNISINFIINKSQNENLRAKKEKNNNKNLDDINFDIFPVKVDKFEFINIVPNEIRTNYNIDVSNIALNQSDYIKQMKGGENDFDYILNKNKEMEDFSQNTPISLLQEKYFIYAVSKWIKYSIPNPQSQMYVKYSYKAGHPMFDPINLIMTNFTLWIERIETKRNDNKKAIITISSSGNYNNSLKNSKNSKCRNSSNKKMGYSNIYSNQYNNGINYSVNENNQMNKKRNNSKLKLSK